MLVNRLIYNNTKKYLKNNNTDRIILVKKIYFQKSKESPDKLTTAPTHKKSVINNFDVNNKLNLFFNIHT